MVPGFNYRSVPGQNRHRQQLYSLRLNWNGARPGLQLHPPTVLMPNGIPLRVKKIIKVQLTTPVWLDSTRKQESNSPCAQPDWKKLPLLSESLTTLATVGPIWVPPKPFETWKVRSWEVRRFLGSLNSASTKSRDASLSDSCTPDRCSYSSQGVQQERNAINPESSSLTINTVCISFWIWYRRGTLISSGISFQLDSEMKNKDFRWVEENLLKYGT